MDKKQDGKATAVSDHIRSPTEIAFLTISVTILAKIWISIHDKNFILPNVHPAENSEAE